MSAFPPTKAALQQHYQEGSIARWALLGTCYYVMPPVALLFCVEIDLPKTVEAPVDNISCPELLECHVGAGVEKANVYECTSSALFIAHAQEIVTMPETNS